MDLTGRNLHVRSSLKVILQCWDRGILECTMNFHDRLKLRLLLGYMLLRPSKYFFPQFSVLFTKLKLFNVAKSIQQLHNMPCLVLMHTVSKYASPFHFILSIPTQNWMRHSFNQNFLTNSLVLSNSVLFASGNGNLKRCKP